MTKRDVKNAAPELFGAATQALRYLQSGVRTPERCAAVIRQLIDAIDKASGLNPGAEEIRFVVTPSTAKRLSSAILIAQEKYGLAENLNEWVTAGMRATARRVYITLEADILLLRDLKQVLLHGTGIYLTDQALRRLANQIDAEVLSRSPLEFLADAGI